MHSSPTDIYTLSLHDALPICEVATQPLSSNAAEELAERIRRVIKPFDVAGLTDPSRGPWYPALDPDHKIRMGERSEEHTSELQSHSDLVCRLLLEKKKKKKKT